MHRPPAEDSVMPVNATAPWPAWHSLHGLRSRPCDGAKAVHPGTITGSIPEAVGPMTCANRSPRAHRIAAVLHFIEDHEGPWATVNCYRDSTAQAGYVVILYVTADLSVPKLPGRELDAKSAPVIPESPARQEEDVCWRETAVTRRAPGLYRHVAGS
jgi:hypothetical protein